MTDSVDQAAVELMGRVANGVEAFAAKLDALAAEYGPEVIDAALAVARADAINALMHQIAGAGVMLLLIYLSVRATRAVWRKSGIGREEPDTGLFLTLLCAGAPATVVFLIWANFVGTIWPVVGAFRPELWIARNILAL